MRKCDLVRMNIKKLFLIHRYRHGWQKLAIGYVSINTLMMFMLLIAIFCCFGWIYSAVLDVKNRGIVFFNVGVMLKMVLCYGFGLIIVGLFKKRDNMDWWRYCVRGFFLITIVACLDIYGFSVMNANVIKLDDVLTSLLICFVLWLIKRFFYLYLLRINLNDTLKTYELDDTKVFDLPKYVKEISISNYINQEFATRVYRVQSLYHDRELSTYNVKHLIGVNFCVKVGCLTIVLPRIIVMERDSLKKDYDVENEEVSNERIL